MYWTLNLHSGFDSDKIIQIWRNLMWHLKLRKKKKGTYVSRRISYNEAWLVGVIAAKLELHVALEGEKSYAAPKAQEKEETTAI